MTNYTPRNPWGYIIEMSKYHNAGIWSMEFKDIVFMFKNI